jgi:hypothetical protein
MNHREAYRCYTCLCGDSFDPIYGSRVRMRSYPNTSQRDYEGTKDAKENC